jgi:hypothetical protein
MGFLTKLATQVLIKYDQLKCWPHNLCQAFEHCIPIVILVELDELTLVVVIKNPGWVPDGEGFVDFPEDVQDFWGERATSRCPRGLESSF